jgi:hypothetical protein
LVACVALPGLIAIGCGGDDDDGGGSPNPTNTPGGNTPVPTATSPDNTPVPTATPGGDDTPTPGNGVSTQVQAFVGSAIGSIGDLGMTGQASSGAGAAPLPFPITSPCMPSGTVTLDCVQGGGGITFSNDFDMCSTQVPGLDSFIDGEVTIESNGTCLNPFPTGTTATVTFIGELDISSAGGTFAGTLDVVSEVTVSADGTSMLDSSGSITSDCIGGTATFETTDTIVTPPNSSCPTAGRIEFDIDGASHDAEYMADGSVVIDGETFDSCEDLAQCS